MEKKTKILIIGGVALVALIVGILMLTIKKDNNYPEQPISQQSLGGSKESISVDISDLDSSEYSLLGISSEVMLSKVEEFVNKLSSSMEQKVKQEGIYYKWIYKDQYVSYELMQNILTFSFPSGINWTDAEITGESFSKFVKMYFDKDWDYELAHKETDSRNQTKYYAKRLVNDTVIETTDFYNQTDLMVFKNQKIVYGKILLTDFFDSDINLPLISGEKLKQYINTTNYPKEIYPDYSILQASVLGELDYLSEDFEDLNDTLSDCKSTFAEVIYLYKRLNQEVLTPVYKMDVMCEVSYKDEKYSVPATAYTNAVEPDYVLVSE